MSCRYKLFMRSLECHSVHRCFATREINTKIILSWAHDDVIKWKQFPRYWPFVRGIHRSPDNSLHKGQWRGALMFSLICVWINGWVNNREAGDLRRYRAHYEVNVMSHTVRYSNTYIILYTISTLMSGYGCLHPTPNIKGCKYSSVP